MEFSAEKMRGRMDRAFTPVKIPLHKNSSYDDIVTTCREFVWGDGSVSSDYQYYLADGSGTPIAATLSVSLSDGTKETLPWTISKHLQVAGVRYPSRMRLYSLRRLQCPGIKLCIPLSPWYYT